MEPYLVFIPISLITFIMCWKFIQKQFPNDPAGAMIFSLLPIFCLVGFVVIVLFKPYRDNCRTITQIGGCDRYACGVLTSNNTKESVSTRTWSRTL